MEKDLWKKLDKVILFVPLAIIIALCIVFLVYPGKNSEPDFKSGSNFPW